MLKPRIEQQWTNIWGVTTCQTFSCTLANQNNTMRWVGRTFKSAHDNHCQKLHLWQDAVYGACLGDDLWEDKGLSWWQNQTTVPGSPEMPKVLVNNVRYCSLPAEGPAPQRNTADTMNEKHSSTAVCFRLVSVLHIFGGCHPQEISVGLTCQLFPRSSLCTAAITAATPRVDRL